jgi:hypothetical protein
MKNLTEVQDQLATNGGFSYGLALGDLGSTENYSVSYAKDVEQIFDSIPTEDEVLEYVNKHITLLAREDFFLGGWAHKGQYYLDVAQALSKREYSREAAIQVGREREQIAIFDLEYFEEIACEETVYVRKCDVTGKGMNQGWLFGDAYYVAGESDALAYCIENGYSSIQEAYDDDFGYYTEWSDEDAWEGELFDKNGNIIERP